MNIDLKKKNKELSIITLEISSQDYKDKVESILNDYKTCKKLQKIYKKKKLFFFTTYNYLYYPAIIEIRNIYLGIFFIFIYSRVVKFAIYYICISE